MFGVHSFSYSLILPRKLQIRNQLILFNRNGNQDDTIISNTDSLAALFLINTDNIGGEPYTEEDYKIINPILDAYLRDENIWMNLNIENVRVLIDLAMNRRLDLERNEVLAVKLAEHYNKNQSNELLLIRMDTFREVCRSIDDPENRF